MRRNTNHMTTKMAQRRIIWVLETLWWTLCRILLCTNCFSFLFCFVAWIPPPSPITFLIVHCPCQSNKRKCVECHVTGGVFARLRWHNDSRFKILRLLLDPDKSNVGGKPIKIMNERELGSILFNNYNIPRELVISWDPVQDPKGKVACRQFNSVQHQRKLTTPTKLGIIVQDSSSDVRFKRCQTMHVPLAWNAFRDFCLRLNAQFFT